MIHRRCFQSDSIQNSLPNELFEALADSLRTSQFFEILLFAIHDSKFTIHTLYMLIRVVRGQIFCTCEFSAVMLYIVMFRRRRVTLPAFSSVLGFSGLAPRFLLQSEDNAAAEVARVGDIERERSCRGKYQARPTPTMQQFLLQLRP